MLPIAAILAAAVLAALVYVVVRRGRAVTRSRFVALMDECLAGRHSAARWGEVCDLYVTDPALHAAQRVLRDIEDQFPPDRPGRLCGDAGFALIRRYRDELAPGSARAPRVVKPQVPRIA